jgi:hypothetical protein
MGLSTMNAFGSWRCVAGVLAGAWIGVASSLVQAADLGPPPPPPPTMVPGWQFQLTGYGWAIALDGDIAIRNLPPVKVNASFIDVLSNLEGAFMGSFLAKNDQWLILTDLVWAKLGEDAVVQPPGIRHPVLAALSPGLGVEAQARQLIASGLVGYRVPLPYQDMELSLTAGVRYQRITNKIKLIPGLLPFGVNNESVNDWADPTIGFFMHYKIDDKWFVNALADIGGFNVGSKITAQGFATVGYQWTPALSTAFGYRAIYTDYQSNTFTYNVTMHGPFASIAYHF